MVMERVRTMARQKVGSGQDQVCVNEGESEGFRKR